MKTRMKNGQAGMTLVEALIASLIFIAVLLAVYGALAASMNYENTQKGMADMQMGARKALERMSTELRMTGRFINPIAGQPGYPYIFTNGVIPGTDTCFAALAHTAAPQHLTNPNPACGACHEIAFKIPWDVDGDGQLTNAATGQIEWSPDIYNYVVVNQGNGINVLERRKGAVVTDILASYVERMTCDTIYQDATIGLNEIVITLYMAKPDSKGRWLQTTMSACVTMRNSQGS